MIRDGVVSPSPGDSMSPGDSLQPGYLLPSGEPGREPIAVIGLACRFANGIDSPEKFWNFIMAEKEAIGEIPPERWDPYIKVSPEYAGRVRGATRSGAFMNDIAGFDAEFFGISPREAQLMDPQQRVVLEVSWEALEHAGIPPRDLAATDTGVFVGVGSDDYGRRLLEDIPRIEAWTGIGSSFCGVANRVSYTLDLRGPSLAVDTACSASLAAIHLACQSLWVREIPLALAGGVLIMAAPGLTVVLDAAGATAPDGRCKSFDASANGYGRGEGAGMIVLKRLADARRDGDRVLALIRGGAVHQEGKTNGIMAPNQVAQEHLLWRACRAAGVSPTTVDYVEAHATGTQMGDPVEVAALAKVFGADRPASRPCLLGSVKPNIGHLEAGAGVASVIKAVLALHHGLIPPTRSVSNPNPAISWDESGLAVVTRPSHWPQTTHPRRAGVSGFGYGGTIAHIVLEEAGADDLATGLAAPKLPDDQLRVFPISGASEASMREYAGRLADWLDRPQPETAMVSVQYMLARRRSHLRCRAAVLARHPAQLAERLRALAQGELPAGTAVGSAESGRPDLVWVYSGHGSQWPGMGRELLAQDRAFATAIDKLGPTFLEEIGFTPRDVIEGDDLVGQEVIQPLIFAVQVGLSAAWRSQGLRPDAVIGHSVGEIAAVVAAGILSPEDGARLVCRRSRLLKEVAGSGAMVLVNLGFAELESQLLKLGNLAPAVLASPVSTVIAGNVSAVEEAASRWRDEGLVVRRINSDVAFHSADMDPLLDRLRLAASELVPRRPQIPVYTTALANPRARAEWDGDYWAANLRNPVRFAEAIRAALEDGYRNFLEVSAHPIVTHSIEETAGPTANVRVAHTLRRAKPEVETMLTNLAVLYCRGVPMDPQIPHRGGQVIDLPVTAWQHRRFWAESGPDHGGSSGLLHDPASHSLLGARIVVNASTPTRLWQTRLDVASRPYPGKHPVHGVAIVPAAVLLNTFLIAGNDVHGQCMLTDVRLRVPISVAPRDVQVTVQDGAVRLVSRLYAEDVDSADVAWLTHSTATIARAADQPDVTLSVGNIRGRCTELLDPNYAVDRLASAGVTAMGFDWTVTELRRGMGELFAVVRTAEDRTHKPATWAPALDAALSIASIAFVTEPGLRMPAEIRQVTLSGECPGPVLISVRTVHDANAGDVVDVDIAAVDGKIVARLSGLRYGILEGDPDVSASPGQLVYELRLREREQPPAGGSMGATPPCVVVVGCDASSIRRVAGRFRALGTQTIELTDLEGLAELPARMPPDPAVLVIAPVPDAQQLVAETTARSTWLLTSVVAQLSRLTRTESFRPRLWCVTRGVREGASTVALAHSGLHGLGRVAAGEHPEIWGAIVDVDSDLPEGELADVLLPVLAAAPADDLVVVRDGRMLVERLAPVSTATVQAELSCRADGAYLVTGGLGALGLEVAAWLASRGARRLILASRRGLPRRDVWGNVTSPEAVRQIAAIRALEAKGVTVRVVALDVADLKATAAALAEFARDLPPICGVVHAAGVLDNRMIRTVDEPSLRAVLRPKVHGALTLHELFPPGSVDFMVFFSSCGQLLGLTGQASYAAGNAFLDKLACHRRRGGHTDTLSLAWTSWHGMGMSVSSAVIDVELATRGVADVASYQAFQCWDYAHRHGGGHYVVLRLLPDAPGISRLPILSEVSAGHMAAKDTAGAQDDQWRDMEIDDLRTFLHEAVAQQVAAETRVPPAELDMHRPLPELGLDSVMATIVRRQLERRFGLGLPATLLWEHPTASAIAEYLLGHLAHA
jgi:6-methylsalicylic acid synthase